MDTIQNALKELYYSLGGSADNVRNITDANAIIAAITALGLGEEIAEGGGGSGILTVTATLVENNAKAATKGHGTAQYRLDKTWREIADADFAVIRAAYNDGYAGTIIATVAGIGSTEGQYSIISSIATFTADSADGYPSATVS